MTARGVAAWTERCTMFVRWVYSAAELGGNRADGWRTGVSVSHLVFSVFRYCTVVALEDTKLQ